MLTGVIRKRESRTVPVPAATLADALDAAGGLVPAGWEMTTPPRLRDGAYVMIIERRDELAEVEGPDIAAIRALVPDGWQLLYVLTAD